MSNLKKLYKYLKNLTDIFLEYCHVLRNRVQNYYNLKEITPLETSERPRVARQMT